jgi:hypothetical protein
MESATGILFDSPSDSPEDVLINPSAAADDQEGARGGATDGDSYTTLVPVPKSDTFGTKTPTRRDMPKPIMGEIVRTDDETTIAWVGGKPFSWLDGFRSEE